MRRRSIADVRNSIPPAGKPSTRIWWRKPNDTISSYRVANVVNETIRNAFRVYNRNFTREVLPEGYPRNGILATTFFARGYPRYRDRAVCLYRGPRDDADSVAAWYTGRVAAGRNNRIVMGFTVGRKNNESPSTYMLWNGIFFFLRLPPCQNAVRMYVSR